jgi:hypothetical protein
MHRHASCALLLSLLLAVIFAKEKVVPDVVDGCTDKAAFKVQQHCLAGQTSAI